MNSRMIRCIQLMIASVLVGASAAEAGLKIYYIRHAEGGHNVREAWVKRGVPKDQWPAYVGDPDVFTPKGLEQQAAVAEKLKKYHFDFIASSQMWRCRNTILPYMKEVGSKSEIWPELREQRASALILDMDLPGPTAPILGMGRPVKLPADESPYFSLREDGMKEFKVPRAGATREHDERSSAAARVVMQHVIDMIHDRFDGTDKVILLSGHNSSGKALLRMLTKDPLKGFPALSNTGIWMVQEQPNGEFKLMIFNDEPVNVSENKNRGESTMFQRLDKDQNGSVDSEEYVTVFMASARDKDSNRDGLLTLEEFPYAGSFKAGDVDQSGTLTMDETKAMYLKQFHGRDKNKDGVVTDDEMS